MLSAGLINAICEHAAGNYRVLMNMANDLLAEALRRELDTLDEKLFFEVFDLERSGSKKRSSS